MPHALVTGGSSGIGAAFAEVLAESGYDLTLVARDTTRLRRHADALIRRHRVRVEMVVADLADRQDVMGVANLLSDSQRPIELLVNNAGFAVPARLSGRDSTEHERALRVMVDAVLILAAAAADAMKVRGHGAIINISSIAGYIATGSYAAIKAWVTAYSESLAVELLGTGVTVTALTPGWVRTDFHQRAGIAGTSIPAFLWTTPRTVVLTALKDSARGRVISVPTLRFRFLLWWCRHLPRSVVRRISLRLTRARQDEGPVLEGGWR